MLNILKRIFSSKIFKFKINFSKLHPRNFTWRGFKEFLRIFAYSIFIVVCVIIIFALFEEDYSTTDDSSTAAMRQEQAEKCNVSGIELHGKLTTYLSSSGVDQNNNATEDQVASEDIAILIEEAEKNEKMKAILLEIDSYGGSPVAAEEVMKAMKSATKPTVALVRTSAVSAAYWSATGANIIFASAISDIGGIGVTSSYLDNSKKNIKDGLTYNSLSTGIFKDAGDPDKPLTEAEKKMFMRDSYIILDNYINTVATNRKLEIEKVKAMADGSSMLGEAALQNGLIDRIGGMPEVKEYLKEKIGEDVELCW